jgi:hypothetical protein
MLTPLPMKTGGTYTVSTNYRSRRCKASQVDSAKPRPPYTGAKYRVGRALAPPFSRSRGAGARFALDRIRHPQSEPPEMGFALGSGSALRSMSCACVFSLSPTSEAEFAADVIAGLEGMLGPGARLGASKFRCVQTSLMRCSSKSRHSGMMPSRLSDQTTSTRSSRYRRMNEHQEDTRGTERTMKAPHCSLSARGKSGMLSRIWMRVSSST